MHFWTDPHIYPDLLYLWLFVRGLPEENWEGVYCTVSRKSAHLQFPFAYPMRIKPLIRPVFLLCLSAPFPHSSSQGRLLIVYTRPSNLRPVYMSLPEVENRFVSAERRDPEHLGNVDVSSLSSLLDWFKLISSTMYRATLSMAMTIPTSILLRRYSKLSLHISKSGLLSQTQMIPRWLHQRFVLGSSVSFGLSLFLVSISSFTSDILTSLFPWPVFNSC
jgi:hypothetical protein